METELFSIHRFREVIGSRNDIYFYCVDPGAFFVMELLVKGLPDKNIFWVVEGWCSEKFKKDIDKKFISLDEFYEIKKKNKKITFVLGSQTKFEQTMNLLKDLNQDDIYSIFIFDHWVNYKNHFYDALAGKLHLPKVICIMDEVAKRALIEELCDIDISSFEKFSIEIIGHPKIEDGARIIEAVSEFEKKELMEKLNITKKKVQLFLLEPISTDYGLEQSITDIGYNEYSTLLYYFAKMVDEETYTIIKPHPRQNLSELNLFFENSKILFPYKIVKEESLELLISISNKIFGMTTLALILAHFSMKEIFSLQLNRTEFGKKFSCNYLEEHLVI